MRPGLVASPGSGAGEWRAFHEESAAARSANLADDEADRQREQRAHDDVKDPHSPAPVEDAVNSRSEPQPDESGRQGGEQEQAPEGGSVLDGAPRVGREERAGGAHAHEPRFWVDPLKDRGTEVPDGLRPG